MVEVQEHSGTGTRDRAGWVRGAAEQPSPACGQTPLVVAEIHPAAPSDNQLPAVRGNNTHERRMESLVPYFTVLKEKKRS